MSETTMPATEAQPALDEREVVSYELAYHVLPTVAEGEVNDVRDQIAAVITQVEGVIGVEEAPQRFDLAYEITKYLEGKYRRFRSAYFGWIRFTAEPAVVAQIDESLKGNKAILRHLIIRLTKQEEAHPFYFHVALAKEKQVRDVDVEALAEEVSDIDPNQDTNEEVDTSDLADDTTAKTTGADTAVATEVDTDVATADTDTDKA